MSLPAPRTTSLPPNHQVKGEVSQIKSAPRRLTDLIVREWQRAFDLLWTPSNGVTPAARLTEIGTDAAELFAANAALTQFLVTMLTGKDDALVAEIAAKVATIPAFTVHPDGTVTLD